MDGTWASTDTWGGFAAGMLGVPPINEKVPADVRDMAEKAKADIIAGKIKVADYMADNACKY